MAETYPLTQAQSRLPELVSRAQHRHEPVMLTEHGTPVAAIVSAADLAELQHAQDAADLATCQAIKARSGPGVPHEQFMAMLEDATGDA
jgi:prevent-host-death family protein